MNLTSSTKPAKPYADFPLTANGNGQWSKKIRGTVYYFGKWDNPDAALAKYNEEREALEAGHDPRIAPRAANGAIAWR